MVQIFIEQSEVQETRILQVLFHLSICRVQRYAVRTPRVREPLEWNTINRGGCGKSNQHTSAERGLDRATGNEEYVVVSYGNIVRLAT